MTSYILHSAWGILVGLNTYKDENVSWTSFTTSLLLFINLESKQNPIHNIGDPARDHAKRITLLGPQNFKIKTDDVAKLLFTSWISILNNLRTISDPELLFFGNAIDKYKEQTGRHLDFHCCSIDLSNMELTKTEMNQIQQENGTGDCGSQNRHPNSFLERKRQSRVVSTFRAYSLR